MLLPLRISPQMENNPAAKLFADVVGEIATAAVAAYRARALRIQCIRHAQELRGAHGDEAAAAVGVHTYFQIVVVVAPVDGGHVAALRCTGSYHQIEQAKRIGIHKVVFHVLRCTCRRCFQNRNLDANGARSYRVARRIARHSAVVKRVGWNLRVGGGEYRKAQKEE